MKKPRSKKEFVESILDFLFMKEPKEADILLGLICDAHSPEPVFEVIFDNRSRIKEILNDLDISDLKKYHQLAITVADATHCDELNKRDEKMAPKRP